MNMPHVRLAPDEEKLYAEGAKEVEEKIKKTTRKKNPDTKRNEAE